MKLDADLLEFFGVELTGLSRQQKVGLWYNIPRLEAKRELRKRHEEAKLTAERLHDLTLLITGSKDAAEEAFANFALQEARGTDHELD